MCKESKLQQLKNEYIINKIEIENLKNKVVDNDSVRNRIWTRIEALYNVQRNIVKEINLVRAS